MPEIPVPQRIREVSESNFGIIGAPGNRTAPAGNRGLTHSDATGRASRMVADAGIPQSADATPTSLYLYYDAMGLLLYVGITSRASSRQREHNSDKQWWSFVASQEVRHYSTRAKAEAAERSMIGSFNPPFNVQHNPHHAQVRSAYVAHVASLAAPRPGPRAIEGPRPLRVLWRDSRSARLCTDITDIEGLSAVADSGALTVDGAKKHKTRLADHRVTGPWLVMTMKDADATRVTGGRVWLIKRAGVVHFKRIELTRGDA